MTDVNRFTADTAAKTGQSERKVQRDARLWEIAENLHRADLTVQERSEHLDEWRKLTLSKVRQVDAPLLGGEQIADKGFRKTAKEFGTTEQEVRRAEKIASLAPEAKEAARASNLDNNQSALLAAASHAEPEAQVAHIELEARKRQEAAAAREEERRKLRDAEDVHKLNQQQDKAIRLTVEQEFAEWLMLPAEKVRHSGAPLLGGGMKVVLLESSGSHQPEARPLRV